MGIPMRWRIKFSRERENTMFKAHPAVSRMTLAAALLCSSRAAFAADVNSAPAPAPDESNFFTRFHYAYVDK